jgi:hypothetical protein
VQRAHSRQPSLIMCMCRSVARLRVWAAFECCRVKTVEQGEHHAFPIPPRWRCLLPLYWCALLPAPPVLQDPALTCVATVASTSVNTAAVNGVQVPLGGARPQHAGSPGAA